jgi:hypothetical protein
MNFVGGWAIGLLLVISSSACDEHSADADNLTLKNPYKKIIDTEYRIVGEVNAYGIYEDLDKKKLSYITLIPGVGIAGPEVAFKRRIANGQRLKVVSAWQEHKLISNDVYYLVLIQDSGLPGDIQIRLELSRGNEGGNGELNPHFYKRLDSTE